MADKQTTPWEQIDVDEDVSKTDQAASESIDNSIPVGKFLCTITECNAEERDLSDYTIYIASLQCRIDCVIEVEQKILGEDQKPIMREGEPLMKRLPIKEEDVENFNALYGGILIPLEVFMKHHAEKPNTKKRRLFCAKRIGIMSPQDTQLETKDWANAPGNQVVVITEWNHWKVKDTGEMKKNVKIGWSGLDYPGNYPNVVSAMGAGGGNDQGANGDDDFGDI